QQPVAGDLRRISAALKMITDMERIGDQADDIAEIILSRGDRLLTADGTLRAMARAAIRMVSESVDAYVRQDVALAERVIASDDEVDEDFERIKRRLIDGISSGTEDGESVLDLVMIAKYYERIADHATNIAEWVEFSVTGVHKTEIT
ncbi:MAG TPA: phosphate transport system regulatory protein PhoU, partial [Oscillibacter sp.]|nr:phosphate transport system regulatory protein PhoU [Oscillibacter sp.]